LRGIFATGLNGPHRARDWSGIMRGINALPAETHLKADS
jgi:hypothetical protein